jgi:hypothetical protein
MDQPKDQHDFDPAVHRVRPKLEFAEPAWREQEIFVALRAFDPQEWSTISKVVQNMAPLLARSYLMICAPLLAKRTTPQLLR